MVKLHRDQKASRDATSRAAETSIAAVFRTSST
ncbi:MAG: hypothetical protein ACI9WU_003053, partial [Myxococcota bacterium]